MSSQARMIEREVMTEPSPEPQQGVIIAWEIIGPVLAAWCVVLIMACLQNRRARKGQVAKGRFRP